MLDCIKNGKIFVAEYKEGEDTVCYKDCKMLPHGYQGDRIEVECNEGRKILIAFQAVITKEVLRANGKSICHQLKEMRRQFAEANGIDFEEEDCTSEEPCRGTCPYCDGKTRELIDKAKQAKNQLNYPRFEMNTSRNPSIINNVPRDQACDGFMNIPDGIDEELPFG